MSSQAFEFYEENVQDILDKIQKRFQFGIPIRVSDEERKRIISRLEGSLEEAKGYLRRMEVEARLAPPELHHVMTLKIQNYSNVVQRYTSKLNEEKYAKVMQTARDSNFVTNNLDSIDSHIRKQVLMGKSSLERTAESLANSQLVAVETEQIGTEVLSELDVQRQSLLRTRDRLHDTQEGLSRSKKIIQAMKRSLLYNKFLLIVIIFLEIVILAGLVYWKFFL